MNQTNGFFGTIQGPFTANEEIITKIQEQCLYQIAYLSKIGIIYTGNLISEKNKKTIVINNIDFQIGKTKILELEDVQINTLHFKENVNDNFYIDYQYVKK